MRLASFLLLGSILAFGCSSAKTPAADPGAPSDAGPSPDAEGGPPPPTDEREALRQEVERRLDAAAAAGFSGSALVTVDGKRLVAKAYGDADRKQKTPNTIDTAFDFGSVMKDFTAAAIFKLVGAGKLATADTLDAIFDGVPADKAKITVLQLLQHSAGFEAYHDEDGDFEPMTRLEARARIFEQTLLFAPGSKREYSNSGYTLLADIVEMRSGRAFTEYVRKELLAPAAMNQSGFYGDPIWKEVDTAIGYDAETFGDNDPAGWPYTWALVGNGGLVTTAPDLERWLAAIWKGAVLPPAAFDAYRRFLDEDATELEGKTVYAFAGGGDYGLGGVALDGPDSGARVIIGSNTNATFDIEKLAVDLGKLILSAR